ncbi:MAG TPA: HI0074 family nucleotidyltransferase substrate-binding subunit, partial [Syntrophomonadaceae bacterium]|nr:HI0074 family nucleotidyltransferase substrate-binding subunit [Syntrophomonadaceae bacterium]
ENMGIADKNSPRAVLREAFAQKIIANETIWLLMLKDRNMTSHAYNEELAEEIAKRIVDYYVVEFGLLLEQINS